MLCVVRGSVLSLEAPFVLRNQCVEEELNGRLSGAFADIAVLAVQCLESTFACFAKSIQTRAL